jgi:hypothetical protein
MLEDTYADDEYIMELERQEMVGIQHLVDEQRVQQQKQAEELAATIGQAAGPTAALTSLRRLPVPFELSAAQPVMSLASTFSREVRNAVEQAQAMAAKMIQSQGAAKPQQQQEEAAPVNVIELASTGSFSSGSDDGIQIDVTVTTERTGPTWMLPIFPNNMPMFGMLSGDSGDSSKQSDLAVEVAQSVIESALARQASGNRDNKELVLDMTLEDAGPRVRLWNVITVIVVVKNCRCKFVLRQS